MLKNGCYYTAVCMHGAWNYKILYIVKRLAALGTVYYDGSIKSYETFQSGWYSL